MNILTPGGLPDRDRLGNIIQPDFRNMIRLERLLDAENFSDREKTIAMQRLLYADNIPPDLDTAFYELEWFYHCGDIPDESEKKKYTTGKKPRLYDFHEDSNYFYAAFREAYSMDISIKGPPLHWWEFMALLIGLPKRTAMAQRIYYRGVNPDDFKGEQRENVLKMQKAVALKNKKPITATLGEIERFNKDKVAQRFKEAEEALKNKQQGG